MTITVITVDGGKEDTCEITVNDPSDPSEPAEDNFARTETIDFTKYEDTLQGTIGYFQGIVIDATNGKIRANGNSVQINAGTVLKIFVNGSADVKINYFDGYGKDGDIAISKDTDVITLTVKDGENPYVVSIDVNFADEDGKIVAQMPDDKGPTTPSDPIEPSKAQEWTITVADGKGVGDGDGLTVTYLNKDGGETSANTTDFKFDGNAANVTLAMAGMKKGQTITLNLKGFTGSSGNAVDLKAELINATPTNDSPEKIIFDSSTTKDNLGAGTFTYTVNADGEVSIKLLRSESKTTRLVEIGVSVK